tara:strand:- start:13471 stop:13749 length:279 start_codon:yes stop_codon:yes gene_type:complete
MKTLGWFLFFCVCFVTCTGCKVVKAIGETIGIGGSGEAGEPPTNQVTNPPLDPIDIASNNSDFPVGLIIFGVMIVISLGVLRVCLNKWVYKK